MRSGGKVGYLDYLAYLPAEAIILIKLWLVPNRSPGVARLHMSPGACWSGLSLSFAI